MKRLRNLALVVSALVLFGVIFFESAPDSRSVRHSGVVRNAARLAAVQVPLARETERNGLDLEPRAASVGAAVDNWIRHQRDLGRVAAHHESNSEWSENPLGAIARITYSQDGIPIVGMDTRLRVSRDFRVTVESDTYVSLNRFETGRALSADEIRERLADEYEARGGSEGELALIYHFDQVQRTGDLAYEGKMRARDTASDVHVLVRAKDGFLFRKLTPVSEFRSVRPVVR